MEGSTTSRRFRFASFEVDEQTGEMYKQGRRVSLAAQPFQVLVMLLERPGELVSRSDIHQRLWPDGTFVDFDHGLNTAVNRIRDVLGDSASSPRFVETLARRGYRFIAPVEVVNGSPGDAESGPPSAQEPPPPAAATASSTQPAPPLTSALADAVFTAPHEVPQGRRPAARILFLLLQVMYLSFYAISLARLEAVEDVVRTLFAHTLWAVVLLIVTAAAGIPTRLFLIAAAAFDAPGLREKFLRLFPLVLPLDALWALSPFLLVARIGYGAALGFTAALLLAPFAQRTLILMGAGSARPS